MRIYTRKGDDGTTGLLYGGRVRKTDPVIEANGAVDEAQAALGAARAGVERDLYVLMAEVGTAPANRSKLVPGRTLVSAEMVAALEARIDELTGRFPPLTDFVVPGQDRVSASLDVARTAVRRAERCVVAAEEAGGGVADRGSSVAAYLNRLSDLVWTMARWQEHGESLLSRQAPRHRRPNDEESH